MVSVYNLSHLDTFPTPMSGIPTSPLVVIIVVPIVILLVILLVSITVNIVMGVALAVMYRKTQQLTHTATPTAATHPYEYIDMDKVAEHMSPARTADHTDYTSMTNPQYSNLK